MGASLAFSPEVGKFLVGEMLDSNEGVLRGASLDEFVEFDLERRAVAILRVLYQKHHQEPDDGCPCIDDQLPSVGKMKYRA
jgi:hypothetical protein